MSPCARDAWSVWKNRAWVICVWCLRVCVSVVRDTCVAYPWNKLHAAIAPCSDSLREIPVHAHIRPHTHWTRRGIPSVVHRPPVGSTCSSAALHATAQWLGNRPRCQIYFSRTVVWAGTTQQLYLRSFKSRPQGCCTYIKCLVQHRIKNWRRTILLWLVSRHRMDIHCTRYILTDSTASLWWRY